MKKTFMLLIVVLTVALAFFAMYMVLSSSSVKFLTVSGNSMEPVISEKDVVVVLPAHYSQLKIGDIIVYKHEIEGKEFSFTHRIVDINDDGFRTKGDALDEIDPYIVKPTEIVGIFKFKIPYLGTFFRFANTTPGFILLIIIPASLIIASEIKNIIRYSKSKKEEGK